MIDDLTDEPEYDEGPHQHDDRTSNQRVCFHCHRETAGESCGFCGNDLCPSCWEMGGGFCSVDHTQEQIDAYGDEAYPPANESERRERIAARERRDWMKKVGVL